MSETKSYKELILLPTFEERFEYLKMSGSVGEITFGAERYLNQIFYTSAEWKHVRNLVIVRDGGCDLGIADRVIHSKTYVHHINPLTVEDVLKRTPSLFDPDNLITVSFRTHNAIHYGDANLLTPSTPLERSPNDQAPWRK